MSLGCSAFFEALLLECMQSQENRSDVVHQWEIGTDFFYIVLDCKDLQHSDQLLAQPFTAVTTPLALSFGSGFVHGVLAEDWRLLPRSTSTRLNSGKKTTSGCTETLFPLPPVVLPPETPHKSNGVILPLWLR